MSEFQSAELINFISWSWLVRDLVFLFFYNYVWLSIAECLMELKAWKKSGFVPNTSNMICAK